MRALQPDLGATGTAARVIGLRFAHNLRSVRRGCDGHREEPPLCSERTELLTASECAAIAALYAEDRHFRSHIVMARQDSLSSDERLRK